jgi:hypothetical protein
MAAVVAGAAITAGASMYSANKAAKAGSSANRVPGYVDQANQFAVSRSREIADREYTPYTHQRVAGISGNEQKATEMAGGAALADSRNYLDKAGALTDQVAGSEWNAETADKYMNPYIGKVVDASVRKTNETYSLAQAGNKANAAAVGAFGGDRATLLEAQTAGEHERAVGDLTAKGYSDAYNQAFQGWQADNQRRLAASDSYRQVGGDITKMNTQQVTDLLRTGQVGRLLEQADLDFDYQQFIENRDWDIDNLQPLLQTLGSINSGGTTTTSQSSGVSKTAAVLGALGTVVGYYGGQSPQSQKMPEPAGGTGAGGGTALPVKSIGDVGGPAIQYA